MLWDRAAGVYDMISDCKRDKRGPESDGAADEGGGMECNLMRTAT